MKKKDTKGMGHNNPPKELADLINDQGLNNAFRYAKNSSLLQYL